MPVSERIKSALDFLSTAAVVVVAGLFTWTTFTRPAGATIDRTSAEPLKSASIQTSALTKRLGNANTIVIEFADFQCPYCARHATETFPRLKHDLIDKGTISYAFLHFPLQKIHKRAFAASEAAECAARQDKYWEMHARLFADQSRLSAADLLTDAQMIGLDQVRFSQCLSGEGAAAVNADIEQGERLAVHSTPVFFVGLINADGSIHLTTRLNGAAGFDNIAKAVASVGQNHRWSLRGWFSL
jgi:protein-disulfide isomerase